MSRLDQHVSAVQTRMMISVWLRALAWAGIAYAIVVGAAILIYKLVQLSLPHQEVWFWAGLGVTIAVSIAYTIWQRPSRSQAAVAIDERLALKEKFSTALYARSSNDPFAVAAVRDAEHTASSVNLQRRFPIRLPRVAGGTVLAILVVLLIAWFFPMFDLFGVKAAQVAKSQAVEQSQQQARDAVHRAILAIDAAPPAIAEKPEIQMAKRELLAMKGAETIDPDRAQSTGEKAIEQVQQAIKQKIQDNKDFAINQEEMKEFKNMAPPADEPGPIADAHRNLAQGKFDAAVEDLAKAVNNFSKMDSKDQEKAAKQMDHLSKAIQQMANDPKVQQNIKQQLQNMGASQQQQQQMQSLMQQAAAGNQQASQQLQQMAKQMAQQMNQSGKNTSQQQRQAAQQIQKQIQQMQQQLNAQLNAQQLASSAQALAAVMKQSAQGGSPGQAKQGANAPMANAQKQQQNQPGGQNGQKQQQMAQAAKQMQQQLQQMQAVANDAQQVAAGQQNNGGDSGEGEGQGKNGQNGQGQNGNGQQANGQQPWGNPQQGGGNGPNMGGAGAGNNRPAPTVAPFATKNETDSQQKDEKGKVLASNFVKAGSLKGDAKMQLHDVLPPTNEDAADEVGEQRVPRQDQDVVRGYFGNLERDTQKQ